MARTQYTMQDPLSQYPAPDIPKQEQPEPGLDKKLMPQAYHGEDTYIGSGRLRGRKALITGGDSGIGRAVAIAFAREGAHVAINYLPEEQKDAEVVLGSIREAEVKALGISADLSDESACWAIVDRTVKEFDGLDILVNNAGKQIYVDDLADLSSEQLVETFTTNVFASFWLVKAALPYLPPGAAIINTSSIQATQPSAGLLDYAATKAAITNFTKGLSQQLAPKGIRVNAVAPGPIWTPLQPSHGQPPDKLVKFGQDTPYERPGQPAELAPAYVFLASQESSYISGEVIGVTGAKLR